VDIGSYSLSGALDSVIVGAKFSGSFSVLLYDSKVINTSANYNNKLIKGLVVKGEFIAKQNNLGAITISFAPMDKVDTMRKMIYILE